MIHHMILIVPDRGRSIRKITFLHTEYENVQNLNMNIEENHDSNPHNEIEIERPNKRLEILIEKASGLSKIDRSANMTIVTHLSCAIFTNDKIR